MADAADLPITEQVLEPLPFGEQLAAPEHYPFLYSFQGEDVLEVTSWNSAAAVVITLQGRVHISPNQVRPFTHRHVANTDRTPATTVATLPRGELLNAIAFVSAGAPAVGQTFVRVAVRRGAGAASERLGVIIQRPITSSIAAAFPGSSIVSPFEAEPFVRTIVGTTPAAGADIVETVPVGARWELMTVCAPFLTGGGGAATAGYFEIDDGANVYIRVRSGNCAGAGTPADFAWSQNVDSVDIAAGVVFSLRPLSQNRMLAGHRLVMKNNNVGANKNWSAPILNVREWLDI